MATVHSISVKWREDGSATVLARITARDGTGATQASGRKLIKQADVSAIAVKVFDVSNDNAVTLTATPAASAVIFDTLQTDWDADSTGYNFKYNIATTAFPTGGNTYKFEVSITTTGGTVAWADATGPAVAVLSS